MHIDENSTRSLEKEVPFTFLPLSRLFLRSYTPWVNNWRRCPIKKMKASKKKMSKRIVLKNLILNFVRRGIFIYTVRCPFHLKISSLNLNAALKSYRTNVCRAKNIPRLTKCRKIVRLSCIYHILRTTFRGRPILVNAWRKWSYVFDVESWNITLKLPYFFKINLHLLTLKKKLLVFVTINRTVK